MLRDKKSTKGGVFLIVGIVSIFKILFTLYVEIRSTFVDISAES